MIKPEQIPDEALEAAYRAFADEWTEPDYERVKAACRALLRAWRGAFRDDMEEAAGVRRRVVLPLHEKDG